MVNLQYIYLIVKITVLLNMTSSDDLQFLLDTDFFLFLDPSETFNALMVYFFISYIFILKLTVGVNVYDMVQFIWYLIHEYDIIFKVLVYHFEFTNFYLLPNISILCIHFIIQACPENPSLLASEDVHNEIVEYPSTLIENPPTDQETLTTNLSFCPEMVPQYQSFHHQNDYSRSFNAVENFPGMVWCYITMPLLSVICIWYIYIFRKTYINTF